MLFGQERWAVSKGKMKLSIMHAGEKKSLHVYLKKN